MTIDNESKSTRAQDHDAGRGQATLANRAHEVADDARQITLDKAESARASAQAAKERAANGVRKFGGTVRKIGEHLRVEDQHYIAEKANDVSQRLDDVATYLSAADVATLTRDTRTLARNNPGWFYGGAFVLGLAAGRFLKGGESMPGRSDDQSFGASDRRPSSARARTGTNDASRSGQQRGQDPSEQQATSSARANVASRGVIQ